MQDSRQRAAQLLADGEALARVGRYAEAEARLRASVEAAPSWNALHDLGTIRQLLGDDVAAEAWLRRALQLAPGAARARASLGLAVLAQGRFREGFALYDAWRDTAEGAPGAAPRDSAPLWTGEPVAGRRLLIWAEEGFGDQIMYARFAPRLAAAGARVAWLCHPALTRLFAEGLGVDTLPAGAPGAVEADLVVPSSRLPVVFMQQALAPPAAPYLRPPPPKPTPGGAVGVFARGNPRHPNDAHRSLPPELASELLALPGAVSLAPEDTGARDFHDTAGLIAGLDLVISVDSAVAHLAGALGKPVWLLLPAIGIDWRWGRGRTDSPWYPTARLFRQPGPGDWRSVLDAVGAALQARP